MTGDSVKSRQSVPHAWNIVNIGEEPYQLDVTWDIGTMGQSKHHIAHDYFNLTDELMNQDHKADSSLPECKSKKANYYVQRGCSFQMRHRLMAYIDRLIDFMDTSLMRQLGKLVKVVCHTDEVLGNGNRLCVVSAHHLTVQGGLTDVLRQLAVGFSRPQPQCLVAWV